MIMLDTGPIVALFNPKDNLNAHCVAILQKIDAEDLFVTIPVLTEAFHLLSPGSFAALKLCEFIRQGGVDIWFMDDVALARATELMQKYADHPMDLADASIVVALEQLGLGTNKVFTLDHNDFSCYRILKGHRYYNIKIIGDSG